MAQQNLFTAADAAKRHPELARKLGVDDEETASWRDAAAAVHIPYDRELGRAPAVARASPGCRSGTSRTRRRRRTRCC